MAGCIPAATICASFPRAKYSAVLTNKVSFITLNFKVTVEVTRIEPPTRSPPRWSRIHRPGGPVVGDG